MPPNQVIHGKSNTLTVMVSEYRKKDTLHKIYGALEYRSLLAYKAIMHQSILAPVLSPSVSPRHMAGISRRVRHKICAPMSRALDMFRLLRDFGRGLDSFDKIRRRAFELILHRHREFVVRD